MRVEVLRMLARGMTNTETAAALGISGKTVTWTGHPRTFWRRLLLARLRAPLLADEVRASLAGLAAFTQAVAT